MVLLAGPWKMDVAGRWVVPSEEPVVLEPACPKQFLAIQFPRLGAGTAGSWVTPGVQPPPKEACSKWRVLAEVAHIQTYLPRRYSEWSLHQRRL